MKCSIVVGLLNSWLLFSFSFIANSSPQNKCIVIIIIFFKNVSYLNNTHPDQTYFSIEQCENTFKITGQSMLGVFFNLFSTEMLRIS